MGSKPRRKSKPPRQPPASASSESVPQLSASDVPNEIAAQEPSATTEATADASALADTVLETADAVDQELKSSSTQHDQLAILEEPLLSLEDARQVVERFFMALLAARLWPSQALALSKSAELDIFVERLESLGNGEEIELSPVQRRALGVVAAANDNSVSADLTVVQDLAAAVTFGVEMLEFQIRQAILERGASKSRGKVNVQRALVAIALSLPAEATTIMSTEFERMLEEKLGVTASNSELIKVVFARIIHERFMHELPKRIVCTRALFFAALESFVLDTPLSLESVEGRLRALVANHTNLRASFQALDSDGSGSLSVEEFVAFLEREAHLHYPRDVLTAFVQRFDVDGDGTLSYDEFVAFVSPKQFGIQVLTPFGLFYQAADRHELMDDVVAKIKTRMFWMQHNDLFATSTNPVYRPPLKLKVTENFILTHHYGTLRLQYKPIDPIAKLLSNGEMVVLVPEACVNNTGVGAQLPPFEYRLKPNVKRTIPPLLSWSLRDAQTTPTPSNSTSTATLSSKPRRSSATTTGRRVTLLTDHERASVASVTTTVASERRLSHAAIGRRPTQTRKATGRGSLAAIQQSVDTEHERSQKSPKKTQSSAAMPSSPAPSASSSYAYYDPTDDKDTEKQSEVGDDSNAFEPLDGDEGACPAFCVEDANESCDEDALPPYDDG